MATNKASHPCVHTPFLSLRDEVCFSSLILGWPYDLLYLEGEKSDIPGPLSPDLKKPVASTLLPFWKTAVM